MVAAPPYRHVLSIDWDWFFPLAAKLQGECPDCSWYRHCHPRQNRYGSSGHRPTVCSETDDHARWGSHTVAPLAAPWALLLGTGITGQHLQGADLWVADCHADLLALLGGSTVVNLDAHDDLDGYARRTRLGCGTWAFLGLVRKQILRYQWVSLSTPKRATCWHDHAVVKLLQYTGEQQDLEIPDRFDCVFVCWSRPWTPVQHDQDLAQFCTQLSTVTGSSTQITGRGKRGVRQLLRHGAGRAVGCCDPASTTFKPAGNQLKAGVG
jgi:hypothetical protein